MWFRNELSSLAEVSLYQCVVSMFVSLPIRRDAGVLVKVSIQDHRAFQKHIFWCDRFYNFNTVVFTIWCRRSWWATGFRIGSRLAPLQAWPGCFPFYRSLCEATVCRLATLGKVEGEGVAPMFPFGFWFSCLGLVFLVSSHQPLDSLAGRARSRKLHLQLFSPRELRRRPGYVLR